MTNKNEESWEVSTYLWRSIVLGVGIATTLLYPIREYLHDRGYHRIPTQVEIQEGYVDPSKLEIAVSDLDGNGKKELSVKYGDKSYLLVEDSEGNPKFSQYELKAEEVKPARINLSE